MNIRHSAWTPSVSTRYRRIRESHASPWEVLPTDAHITPATPEFKPISEVAAKRMAELRRTRSAKFAWLALWATAIGLLAARGHYTQAALVTVILLVVHRMATSVHVRSKKDEIKCGDE